MMMMEINDLKQAALKHTDIAWLTTTTHTLPD